MLKNLEIFQGKVVCPRCDGNGLVSKIRVEPLHTIMYICDECEATWIDPKDISIKTFIDLTTYLKNLGYTYTGVSYEDEDYYWYEPKKTD